MQQSSSSKTRVPNSNVNAAELRAVSPSSRQARKRSHNVSSQSVLVQDTGTTEPPSKRATRGSAGPSAKSDSRTSDMIQIKSEAGEGEDENSQSHDSLDDPSGSSAVTFDESSLNEVSRLLQILKWSRKATVIFIIEALRHLGQSDIIR